VVIGDRSPPDNHALLLVPSFLKYLPWIFVAGALIAVIIADQARRGAVRRADRIETQNVSLRADTTLLGSANREFMIAALRQNEAMDSLITADSVLAARLNLAERDTRRLREDTRRHADSILVARVPAQCDSAMVWMATQGRSVSEGW